MEKESVKVFDLQAAFKALDEIEAPKTKGLKANRVSLKETFATKTYGDSLIEDYYSVTDHEALEEAQEDREDEIAKAKLARIEKIVDLDAESPEDLEPSYVGKVIIQCPQCMTLFYKKPEDIEHSEENPDVVNVNEVCQHCGNDTGYMLIGKVGAVEPEEAENFETEEETNELDLDFGEPTEEVSPEGTGGGFEDELGSEGSEDELDLNLEEVELEPTEESLKVTEAKEDSDSEDKDEKEVEVTIGEIKDVAEEAGKAVLKAEVEEKEEVKEVTDKVVEKEVEVEKETLTESLKESFTYFLDASGSWGESDWAAYEEEAAKSGSKVYYFSDKLYTDKEEAKKGGTSNGCKEIIEFAKAHPEEDCIVYTDDDYKHQGGEELDTLENVKIILRENLEEKKICPKCGKEICECDKNVKEGLPGLDSLPINLPNLPGLGEECEHCEDKKLTEAPQTPDEIERILWSVADSFDESLEENKTIKEDKVSNSEFKDMINSKVWQDFGESLTEDIETVKANLPMYCNELEHAGEAAAKAMGIEVKDAEKEMAEESLTEATTKPGELPWWVHPLNKDVKEGIFSAASSVVNGVANGVKSLLASDEAEKKDCEDCEEGLGTAIANVATGVAGGLVNLLASDEGEKASIEEDAIMNKNDSQGRVDNRQINKPEEKETSTLPATPAEGITEDAIVPNMDFGGININLDASGQNNAVGFGGSQPKVEDYTGTPEERTTHLEYVDDDVTDGKAVLPKNITKKEDDHCEKNPVINHDPDDKDILKETITDLDEEYFDRHINNYLKEVYSNIKEYKSTSCELKEDKLFIEGIITFNSGKTKKTVFEFIAPVTAESGDLICEGYNKSLTEEKAFTLKGAIEDGCKFITESFDYNYKINGIEIKGSK